MLCEKIVPTKGCVVDVLTVPISTNTPKNISKQLLKQLIRYLKKVSISGVQENFINNYKEELETEKHNKNQILHSDLNYLKECVISDQSKLLNQWLSEIDSSHQQLFPNNRLLANNKTFVMLKITSKSNSNNLSISLPLYQSIFYQNDRFQDKDIISYPSVSNIFDLFDDKWFDSIESANIAAFNEFGYKLANPDGQLVIRWAIDLSDYYSVIGIDENNAHKMIEPIKFPRTISGKSAGSAFAVSVLQLLARAYLNHDYLFRINE